MIEYIKGNIFDSESPLIGHGVNCCGVFNAGLAKQIRAKFPNAYKAYMEKYNKDGWEVGQIQVVDTIEGKKIANLATQKYYRRGKKYVSYYGIEKSLQNLIMYCENNQIKEISIPKLGCGLGGGDFEMLKKIITQEFLLTDIYVQVWDK